MDFGILGPLEVRVGGRNIEIGSPKLRALLIVLLVNVGRTVPAERLIDDLWGGQPPARALVSLRSYISNLRKILIVTERDGPVIGTKGRGYMLDVDLESVDAFRFEKLLARARTLGDGGDHRGAVDTWDAALSLWRGDALADVMYEDFARAHIARLDELRVSAEEDRIDAFLSTGGHAEAIPTLEAMVTAHPLRERPHAQLMVALYRAGRAPHALEVFQAFRGRLVEELGLDPSPQFVALSDSILRQAPELEAAIVAGPATTPPVQEPPAASSRLVGRERELPILRAAVEDLRSGRGRILLVGGEAGIGKTSLVQELAALAQGDGVSVHWGACDEADGTPPFWPWSQILRSVVANLTDEEIEAAAADIAQPVSQLIGEVAGVLGQRVEPIGPDPESARFALYEAVSTFLARVADERPLMLVVDDLHWADTTSLQLLSHLGRHVGARPVLVAATYRSLRADRRPELDATLAALLRYDHTDPIELEGLDLDAVASMLVDAAGTTFGAGLADIVRERTNGNPFFVRQVGRFLAESIDSTDAAAAAKTIPTGVRHVILQRLRLLPDAARRTLDAAAVVGREFDVRIVAEATRQDIEVVLGHLDTAIDHGLVMDSHGHGSTYSFVHALINETIYEALPPGAVARLHAAVGLALEARPHPSVTDLAEHFWRAADLIGDDRSITYMREAAEQALEVLAYEQGVSLLRRTLHLLAHRAGTDPHAELEVRLRLLQLLTSVFGWTADEIEEVASPVKSAVTKGVFGPDLLSLWWSLWAFYLTRGDLDASRQLADAVLEVAQRDGHPACFAAAHTALAHVTLYSTGDVARVLEHCTLARGAETSAGTDPLTRTPEHLSVQVQLAEALASGYAGDVSRAFSAADEAIEIASRSSDPWHELIARGHAGLTAALCSDPERVDRYMAPAIEAAQRLGLRALQPLLVPAHAWGRAHLGDDPREQADRITHALGLIREAGHRLAEAQWLLFLADVHLLAQDAPAAAETVEEAKRTVKMTGECLYDTKFAEFEARLGSLTTHA